MKIFNICFTFGMLTFAQENESSPTTVLDTSNFYSLVVDTQSNKVFGTKPWFVKFYAPWCGHCKNLAPTWDELYLNQKDVNFAKVDCTTDTGKPLCQEYEVKGFPTLLFFPTDEQNNGKFLKYSGRRDRLSLEEFALGGYLSVEQSEEIPKQLEGVEFWKKWTISTLKEFAGEIDFVFYSLGLAEYVPQYARYGLVLLLCCLPCLMLIALIFCCGDEPEPPKLIQKVAL